MDNETDFNRFLATVMACFWVFLCTSANAFDAAEREIYGFSMDGGLFAFEEFGVQDGSGFPYSNIYVIDTATDSWTAGSPYRVLLKDETKDVFDAREEARILAGPVMKSFEARGNVIATNRPTELTENPKRMVASRYYSMAPHTDALAFSIELIQMDDPEGCYDLGDAKGFRLLQLDVKSGDTLNILHEDTKIPSSRHCPLDYDFADIVTYSPENGSPVAAILILMKKVGFEGPDARYLAVTTKLDLINGPEPRPTGSASSPLQ